MGLGRCRVRQAAEDDWATEISMDFAVSLAIFSFRFVDGDAEKSVERSEERH